MNATPVSPVLIVGSIALDDLELPSGAFRGVVGGAATFAALSTTIFAPARLVAIVGEDFPQAPLDRLAERGADLSGLVRAPGKTFSWHGRYAENLASRETLGTHLNVFADFKPRLPSSYADSELVLLGNIHPALQLEVLSQVKAPRFVVADTMNFWIAGENALLREVLAKVDTLVVNDEEVRQLAGCHNLRRAAAAVRAMGPRHLIVKRGEHGAMLFDEAGLFYAPAYPLESEVDPTGAGDTFAGALLGYVASHGLNPINLRRGLLLAGAVASFCVEDVGTRRLEQVTRAQAEARLAELRELIQL